MILARAGVGSDFGVSDAVGSLLAAARIGLEVWKHIDSQALARESLRLDKLGLQLEAAATHELMLLKMRQEELAAVQAENLTSSISTGTYLAIGAMALVAIMMGRR